MKISLFYTTVQATDSNRTKNSVCKNSVYMCVVKFVSSVPNWPRL